MPYEPQPLRYVVGVVYAKTRRGSSLSVFGVISLSPGQYGCFIGQDCAPCVCVLCRSFLLMDSASASTKDSFNISVQGGVERDGQDASFIPLSPRPFVRSIPTSHCKCREQYYNSTSPSRRPSSCSGSKARSETFLYLATANRFRHPGSLFKPQACVFLRVTSGKLIPASKHTLTGAQPQRPRARVRLSMIESSLLRRPDTIALLLK